MKIKGNIKYFVSTMVLIGILIINGNIYATNMQGVDTKECTEQYKIWSSLSEEEKSKYIEPFAHPIQFDKTYLSENNGPAVKAKSTLPNKYNLNDEIVIPIKHQGNTNECWAFSMISVLESNITKRTGKVSERFSERHMDYATSQTFTDGKNSIGFSREVGDGGNALIALGYATNGTGFVKNSDMPFENNENKIKLSSINKKASVKINDAKIFTSLYKYKDTTTSKTVVYNGVDTQYTDEEITAVRNHIKQYIMDNGALFTYTYANSKDYYNNEDILKATAYYCDSKTAIPDHAVTIVGWDDDYAVSNFNEKHRPQNPGAYIILNSYGNSVMNNGYYYISYEDSLIESSVVGISDTEDMDYSNIYQNDFYGYTNPYTLNDKETLYGANVFTRNTDKSENLDEVVICVPITTNIEVYVNPNGDSLDKNNLVKASIEKTAISETYNTVKFKTPIELTGNKFAIVIKYNVPSGGVALGLELNYKTVLNKSTMFDCITAKEGESFLSLDANQWMDVNKLYKDTNICIKGITTIKTASGNEVNNNTNSNSIPEKDDTVSNTRLPNTGKVKFGIILILLGTIVIVSVYKCRKYKIVK